MTVNRQKLYKEVKEVIDSYNVKMLDLETIETMTTERFKAVKKILERFEWLDTGTLLLHPKAQKGMAKHAYQYQNTLSKDYPHVKIADCYLETTIRVLLNEDVLLRQEHIILAAALFMLDELAKNHHLYDAIELLPKGLHSYEMEIPPVYDHLHSDRLIERMVALIAHRYGSDNTNLFTARVIDYNGHYAYPLHKIFELMDKDVIEQALTRFKNAQHIWIRNYLQKVEDNVVPLITKMNEQSKKIAHYEELESQLLFKTLFRYKNDFYAMIRPDAPDLDVLSDYYLLYRQLDDEILKIGHIEDAYQESVNFYTNANDLYEAAGELEIADPFEMCFAALYMIDHQDEAIWDFQPAVQVLLSSMIKLPFYNCDTDSKPIESDLIAATNQDKVCMTFDDEEFDRHYRLTKNQVIYRETYSLPPRYHIDYEKDDFYRSDLSDEEKSELETIAQLSADRRFREWIDSFLEEDEEDHQDHEEVINALKKQIASLKKDNKALKKALHESEQALQKQEQIKNVDVPVMESQIIEEEEDIDTSITFPYTVTHRTVIYGGHRQWLKEMKKLIVGDIQFYDADTSLSLQLFAHADTVWLQCNHMSHSGYYKIVDICKKNHIDIQYFKTNGKRSCATRLALYDMGVDIHG